MLVRMGDAILGFLVEALLVCLFPELALAARFLIRSGRSVDGMMIEPGVVVERNVSLAYGQQRLDGFEG